MRKKSIHYKLLLSFIAVTLLTLPMSLYTITATNQIKNEFSNLIDFSFPRLQALLEMKIAMLRITSLINNLNNEIEMATVNENTPTKIGATKDQLLAYLGEIDEWQKVYQKHLKNDSETKLNLQELSELRDAVVLAALDNFSAKEKKLDFKKQMVLKAKLNEAQSNLDRFIKTAIITESEALNENKNQVLSATKKIFEITLLLNITIIFIGIIMSLFLANLISRPIINLKKFASNITQDNLDQRALISTHDEIGELTASLNNMLEKLSQAKTELIKTSHAAGMAEVATGILHNVGNVLNSINISSSIISETVRSSKLPELKKINDMLNSNKENLLDYLQNDKRGKLIIPYLQLLMSHLELEHDNVKAELSQLTIQVQHIKHVIAMQQSHHRSKGVIETLSIIELIEMAYAINVSKIMQTDIEFVRDYIELPPIQSVRAQIEQILINLIKNAIEALLESNNPNKKIIIKLKRLVDHIHVCITDNGIGIAKENLSKIFSFGFTTKQDGHGYGIHTSALLAKELGGKLMVSSDGLQKGATFILEIPSHSVIKSE